MTIHTHEPDEEIVVCIVEVDNAGKSISGVVKQPWITSVIVMRTIISEIIMIKFCH